jgi:hypothetical protein
VDGVLLLVAAGRWSCARTVGWLRAYGVAGARPPCRRALAAGPPVLITTQRCRQLLTFWRTAAVGQGQHSKVQGSRANCTGAYCLTDASLPVVAALPGQPPRRGWVGCDLRVCPHGGDGHEEASRPLEPACARHPPGGSARFPRGNVADKGLPSTPSHPPHALTGCRDDTRLCTSHLQVVTPRRRPACHPTLQVGVFRTQLGHARWSALRSGSVRW